MPTMRAKKSARRVRRQPGKTGRAHAALRLLVALDEASARANAPIDTAMALTKAHRAKAEAVSVVDPMAATRLTIGVPVAGAREAALRGEQRLRRLELRRYVADRTGARPPWRIRVPLGTPADAILDAANGADLVIMGLRREGLIERIVHDATTPHVVRECSVPVLAVTPELRGMPRTVVIAADFSPESNAAAQLACRLFTGCARLVFVHIESDFDAAIANLDEITRATRENDWAVAFQRLIETLSVPAGAKVETVVVHGTVPRTLLAFAKRRGADVLVVGRQQHDVAERVLVGSVTAGLVRRAPCSLLITPPTV
ncbi:MAG TPA: universal stress protein [Candidatus Tumulicola sp.]|nr:universal stress protein [Candidatus Tumulicola sp.]HSC31483.1 universal stress protein [Gemmatimonadaceae bacterium]